MNIQEFKINVCCLITMCFRKRHGQILIAMIRYSIILKCHWNKNNSVLIEVFCKHMYAAMALSARRVFAKYSDALYSICGVTIAGSRFVKQLSKALD